MELLLKIKQKFNKKLAKRLVGLFMILIILTPDIVLCATTITSLIDDVKIKEAYGIDTIEYNEIKISKVSSKSKEVINKKAVVIETKGEKVTGYEILSKRTKNTKSYVTTTEKEVTEVYLDAVHKKVGDLYVDIDNTLEDEGTYYTNKVGIYNTEIYKTGEYLYSVSDEDTSIKFKFPEGNLSNSDVNKDKILFSNVYDDVDLEYMVSNSFLKENIIFNKNRDIDTFSYVMNIGNLKVKKENNVLCVYKSKDCLYEIRAPFMKDKENNLNLNVKIDFEKLSNTEVKVILTYNLEWLNAPERVYPVLLDPAVVPTTGDINVDSAYIRGGSGWGNVNSKYEHLFVGYDRNGTASGGVNFGVGRSFIAFAMPNIGTDRRIVTATLQLDKFTSYSPAMNTIDIYKTASYVNPNNVTWNNQPSSGSLTLVSSQNVGNSTGYKNLDITSYIEDLNAGANKTLMLRANIESSSYFPVVFNSEHTGSIPKIVIEHMPDADVDENLNIDTFDSALRVYSKGINEFVATSLDGIAKPNSSLNFKLYKKDEEGNKTFVKDFYTPTNSSKYFIEPVYITNPIAGVQNYLKDNVNYTSDYHNKNEFDLYDTVYGYDIKVTDSSSNTSTIPYETDEFIIYKVKLGDNLAKISSYYGVEIDDIKKDNNIIDNKVKEEDTLFIRLSKNNPKLTPDMYTPKTTISTFFAEFEYLGGCVYGCSSLDPVDLFTGNFYLESKDITLKDYADIELTRTYNSKSEKYSTMFGKGYTFNYDQSIAYDKDENLLYFRGNGSIIKIPYVSGSYVPDVTDYYNVTKVGTNIHIKDLEDNKTYIFSDLGVLISVVDKNNNKIDITHNSYGNILSMVINGNKTINFEYNSYNLVSKIVFPNTTFLSYEYNTKRELIKYTDQLWNFEEYSYDNESRLITIKDKKGNVIVENTYDSEDRVTKQIAHNGDIETFVYETGKTKYTENGRTNTVQYDSNYRLTKQTFPDNTTIKREYDSKNNITKEINELNQSKTYSYNTNNDLTKEVDYNGDITLYEYDSRSNLTKKTGIDGNIEVYEYDINNNLTKYIDSKGSVTAFTYNSLNQKVSESAFGLTTYYTYENGNLKTETLPNGLVKNYYYDSLGNLIKEEDSSGKNKQYIYDYANNLIKEVDTYSFSEEYLYDKNGRKIEYLNKLGGKTIYEYDNAGNVTLEKAGAKFTKSSYNLMGQTTKTEDELGNVLNYSYDKKGRLLKITNQNSKEIIKEYDSAGNITKELDEFGNVITNTYNSKGLLIAKIENSLTENYEYDSNNRLIKTTYENGNTLENTYDNLGNLIKTKDIKGVINEYTYDSNKNVLTEKRIADSKDYLVTNTYDSKNNLTHSVDSNGLITNYTYNSLNQLHTKEVSNGIQETYTYNLYNNIVSTTNEFNQVKITTYDLLDRVTHEKDYLGNVIKTEYDAEGNITKITDPRAYTEITTYDVHSVKTSFTNKNGYKTVYHYSGKGLLSKEVDAYGIETVYSYNTSNLVDKITKEGKVVKQIKYDGFDREVEVTELGIKTEYTYDSRSNITKENNKTKGLITEFSYDKNGNKTLEKDNYNKHNKYEYDKFDRLVKTTNKDGKTETNKYDSLDNVLENKEFYSIKTVKTYDDYGKILEETSKGLTTTYSYDNYERVIKKTLNNEKNKTYLYDTLGNIIDESDYLGNITKKEYDGLGNVVKEMDRNGYATSFNYDGNSNITKETNDKGNFKEFSYDIYDNVIKETDYEGNSNLFKYNSLKQKIEELDSNGFKTTYNYDDNFNLKKITYPYNYTEEYYYNSNRNIEKVKQKNNSYINYKYDLYGNVLEVKDGNNGVTKYSYDIYGNTIKETNPKGYTVNYEYNVDLLTKKYDDKKVINSYSYNGNNELVKEVDANGNVTTYTHDVYGNKKTSKTNTKSYIYTYDYNNNLTLENLNNKLITNTTYDKEDNILTKYENSVLVENNSYDNLYNKTSELVENTIEVDLSYDKNNRVEKIFMEGIGVLTYTYDSKGNIIEEKTGLGGISKYTYDAYSNKTSEINKNNYKTEYEYDSMGNMNKIKDHKGNIINYSYDNNSNLISKRVEQTNEFYSYNLNNELIREVDQYTDITLYEYDNLGNVILESKNKTNSFTNNTLAKTSKNTVTYNYDYLGNLLYKEAGNIKIKYTYTEDNKVSTVNSNSKMSYYTYDNLDNITSYKDTNSKTVKYEYDNNSNNTKIIYPNKKEVSYIYNNKNQVTQILENNKQVISYIYDTLGNEKTVIRDNGIVTNNTYDILGRLTNIENSRNGTLGKTIVSNYNYTYDNLDNVVKEIINKDNKTTNKEYKYNERDELISETVNGKTKTYKYDILGNKIESTDGVVNKIYGYEKNKLTSIKEKGKEQTLIYDEQGNLKNVKENNKTVETYTYDTLNRLVKYEDVRYIDEYTYDGEDHRTNKTTTDKINKKIEEQRVDSLTIKDLDKIIEEENLEVGYERLRNQINGKTCKVLNLDTEKYRTEYEYINDVTKENVEVLNIYKNKKVDKTEIYNEARVKTNNDYYILGRNNSVEEIYNSEGIQNKSYNYTAYGIVDKKEEGFSYTGESRERNGLIYLRARYYKPEYESFISKDTYKILSKIL